MVYILAKIFFPKLQILCEKICFKKGKIVKKKKKILKFSDLCIYIRTKNFDFFFNIRNISF